MGQVSASSSILINAEPATVLGAIADYEAMRGLLTFLVEDCCQGEPAICGPLAGTAGDLSCAPKRC